MKYKRNIQQRRKGAVAQEQDDKYKVMAKEYRGWLRQAQGSLRAPRKEKVILVSSKEMIEI